MGKSLPNGSFGTQRWCVGGARPNTWRPKRTAASGKRWASEAIERGMHPAMWPFCFWIIVHFRESNADGVKWYRGCPGIRRRSAYSPQFSTFFLGAYTYNIYLIYTYIHIIYLYRYVCMYVYYNPKGHTHAHNKKPQMVGVYHGDPQILEPKMIKIMGSK